jgi:hypothetical protein
MVALCEVRRLGYPLTPTLAKRHWEPRMTDNTVRPLEPLHHPRPPEKAGVRWDFTVNIPTMITLAVLMVSIVSFAVTKYSELTKADLSNANSIAALRMDVDKISASQTGVVREMREGLDAMRKENREDFKEVRGSLDRINDRLPYQSPNNMQGWTK